MNDLISRQAAIDAIADYLSKTTYTSAISHLNTGALILARVPSVQPEIIRCKDCNYYDGNAFPYTLCHRNAQAVEENDYCGWAERREEQP